MTLPFTMQPLLPLPLIMSLAGAAMVVAVLTAFCGRALSPRWLQLPVVLLRLAVIALLALVLLNPSTNISLPVKASRSVLLIDDSASMSMAGTVNGSRWDEALTWSRAVHDVVKPEIRRFASDSSLFHEPAPSTPTGQETNLAAALETLASSSTATNIDHVIVVSDGCVQDAHRLSAALAGLRGTGITLSTKAVGRDVPLRNAALASVVPPRMVRAQTRVNVPVEMTASGISTKDAFELILRDEDEAEIARQSVQFSEPTSSGLCVASRKLSFISPPRTTRYSLELRGTGSEATLEDNRFEFTLEVITTKLRVLIAEGTHAKRSLGSEGHFINDIEMITAACIGTGEIDCVVFTPVSQYADRPNLFAVKFSNGELVFDQSHPFPTTREEVNSFDAIMISDVPVGNFSEAQMQWVVDLVVERGGGFLMAGGNTTFDRGNYDKTSWESITPVDMVEYGEGQYGGDVKVVIGESVRTHPIWQLVSDRHRNHQILDMHPVFHGMNLVRRAKPGAVLIATMEGDDAQPVIAVQDYGRGRSMAYMSDPNGAWGNDVIRWSNDAAPSLGGRIELGQGASLAMHTAEARPPSTPRPPHPAPYYGAFWVNTMKWLCENSIRWRRDKLSGKIISAQARPGAALPVSAEFLAETDPAKLALQEIGARLSTPGSPRVRLNYNRDRREFTGVLQVPSDNTDNEVEVVFDTISGNESFTDSARCGVLVQSSEFTRSSPDFSLMSELAQAGGGKVLTDVDSAVVACRAAAEAHQARETRVWPQPMWPTWTCWSVMMILLSMEWFLRRIGRFTPPVIALACLFFVASASAQEATLDQLIEQLAAPKVRLRDEAQEALSQRFADEPALRAAMESTYSEEARLRLKRLLKSFHDTRWQIEWEQPGEKVPVERGMMRGTPNGAWLAHVFSGGAEVIRVPGFTTERIQGKPTTGLVMKVFGFSNDGHNVVFANKGGGVWEENELAQRQRLLPLETRNGKEPVYPTAVEFVPGTKRLVVLSFLGLSVHEPGMMMPVRRITLKQIFPNSKTNIIPITLAVSGDGKSAGIGVEIAGPDPEMMAVVDLTTLKAKWRSAVTAAPRWIAVDETGSEALIAMAERGLERCRPDSDNGLPVNRTIGDLTSVAYAPDHRSAFVTSSRAGTPVRQIALPSGEVLWASSPLRTGCYNITMLGPDRIAAKTEDNLIIVWKQRTPTAR